MMYLTVQVYQFNQERWRKYDISVWFMFHNLVHTYVTFSSFAVFRLYEVSVDFFVIFRQFFHIFRPFWPFFMIIFLYLTAEDRPENRNREIGEDMQQRTTGHNLGYCSKDLVLHEAHILPFELQMWLFFYISLSNTNITYHWPHSNMMLVLLQGEILLFDQTPVDWSNIVA